MRANEASKTDINQMILSRLAEYPPPVAELGTHAIQLAGDLPMAGVIESLDALAREITRRQEQADS